MSSSKFQDSGVTKGTINGPRPLPLRVNKSSHVIHKPHSQQPAASEAADRSAVKLPIIIYKHSPKVIHTQAGAFMAVVQRLTGLQRDEGAADAIKEQDSFSGEKEAGGVKQESNAAVSLMYRMSNAYLMDAPNSNEFFCASRPNPLFRSPNMAAANTISPSFMDYMKAFPDY